ncbi:hypothetical protein MBLNU230_g0029t1 [Neophaeotheca triangularis]
MQEEESRVLHPFFTQPNAPYTLVDLDPAPGNGEIEPQQTVEDEPTVENATATASKPTRSKTKSKKKSGMSDKGQQTLRALVKPSNNAAEVFAPNETPHAVEPADTNQSVDGKRHKRRRTNQDEDVEVGADAPVAVQAASPTATPPSKPRRQSSPRVDVPASSPFQKETGSRTRSGETARVERTPPRKVLRLNAKGTFGSTPPRKDDMVQEAAQNAEEETGSSGKRQRKPRKSKEKTKAAQMLVTLPYHENEPRREEMGETIDRILAGTFTAKPATSSPKKVTPKKQRTPRKLKATHPFFTGKANEKPEPPKPESPRKFSATTPGKLRSQANRDRVSHVKMDDIPEAPYPVGSALLKDRLMVKHPGAREPAWPSREQVHVRGIDNEEAVASALPRTNRDDTLRKGKSARLPFPLGESILRHFASSLQPEDDPRARDDGFLEPHPQLQLPQRLLLPGVSIQQRILPELSNVLDDAADELSAPSSQIAQYGALKNLYHKLPSTLTAFDEGKGEPQSWAHKYAPAAADEVLGGTREAVILRDWLNALTVTAVEGAAAPPEKKTTAKSEPKPKKRRRKNDPEMDDFLVDDEDAPRAMDELSENEDMATDTQRNQQRSVVQSADGASKLNNAVLLSGSYGCGKTAAVYAVAKELGFKVFEISSCDRRSGKDVLEKVGDMTENHIVKHHAVDAGELSAAEDNKAFDEQFQKDLESGRQGKMNAFFAPKTTAKPPLKKKAPTNTKVLEALKQEVKKPAKEQQQSLILLEEVDVLFRDDRDFWQTVFKLIASSKRPFIMTCNDEDLVPSQAMNLHAMLRFSPPPIDIATDYMLLLAASEGHLLKREAVASLYQSKQRDLRASISELDFWCQMGVGDPREGLGWIYQRWPPGNDVDEAGHKLRLVSEGTYQAAMGLLNEDALSEEDGMRQAWREFDISPFDLSTWSNMSASDCFSQSAESVRPLSSAYSLKDFSALAESLSTIDTYTAPGSPSTPLDTTQAPLSDKSRANYTEGLRLLQTDFHTTTGLTTALATASTLLTHRLYDLDLPRSTSLLKPAILLTHLKQPPKRQALTRASFTPLDPLTYPPENSTSTSTTKALAPSALDGPFETLTTEIAPYVRSIARHQLRQQQLREIAEGVLGKRVRSTRAARSAGAGQGERARVRGLMWWGERLGLDLERVVGTGGEWGEIVEGVLPEVRLDAGEGDEKQISDDGEDGEGMEE